MPVKPSWLTQWSGYQPGLVIFCHPSEFAAPLPRSWQWLDGSAFSTHGDLMQVAFGLDPIESSRPLMYQGMSDRFYGPTDDIRSGSTADGIDFEGEFGVIVDRAPMGTSAADAMEHIKLVVQVNDWSLRAIAPIEMKTGFGWVQAKPACSMAPFAVTPDELGDGGKTVGSVSTLKLTGMAIALALPTALPWILAFTNSSPTQRGPATLWQARLSDPARFPTRITTLWDPVAFLKSALLK